MLKNLRRGKKKSRRDQSSGEVVTSPEFLEKAKQYEERKKERLEKKKQKKNLPTGAKKNCSQKEKGKRRQAFQISLTVMKKKRM